MRTSAVLRRAFDKAVRRKPPGVAADAGPYGNSIEGRCGVEMRRGCATEHDRRQRKMKRRGKRQTLANTRLEKVERRGLWDSKAQGD